MSERGMKAVNEPPDPLPAHASQAAAGISRSVWALTKRCRGVAPKLCNTTSDHYAVLRRQQYHYI